MQIYTSGLILQANEVLLISHKKEGACFQPGGKAEAGESLLDGLSRELWEETGLTNLQVDGWAGPVMWFSSYAGASYQLKSQNEVTRTLRDNYGVDLAGTFPLAVVQTDEALDLFYLLSTLSREVQLNSTEHDDIGWFPLLELKLLGITDSLLLRIVDYLVETMYEKERVLQPTSLL